MVMEFLVEMECLGVFCGTAWFCGGSAPVALYNLIPFWWTGSLSLLPKSLTRSTRMDLCQVIKRFMLVTNQVSELRSEGMCEDVLSNVLSEGTEKKMYAALAKSTRNHCAVPRSKESFISLVYLS